MFGYVVTNKQELKIREFDLYRSFYCGLCRELKESYGISGQISLSYDLTFVILLLSALYEAPVRKGTTRCIIHPVMKQTVRKNSITEFAADMNVLLTYYKCMDDWADEKKILKRSYAALLHRAEKRLSKQYPEKVLLIKKGLSELSRMEADNEKDLDKLAGCSGRIMQEILVYRADAWEPHLRKLGFYLGKFIYILDAFDDIEKDRKKNNFNPLFEMENKPDFEEMVRSLLLMMMTEVCREFEYLPILRYQDILRNVLYSGVWCRYEMIVKARRKEKENKGTDMKV